MKTISTDKFERIECQVILNHEDYVVGKNLVKEKIVSEIAKKITDIIKVSETETPFGVKLRADILFINFKDLDNIYENKIMEMTQKQIEIEAQNYLNGLDLPENADKQLILENFKNGIAWAMLLLKEDKQQWIEEATEWLKHNIYDYFYWIEMEGESEANIKDTLFDDFKQEMKGE